MILAGESTRGGESLRHAAARTGMRGSGCCATTEPVNKLKTVGTYVLIGAFVGGVIASFVVPPVLAWYNETGKISSASQVQTLCNLPELIRYTSSRLLRGQLIGAAIGALVFLYPGFLAARRAEEAEGSSTPA